MHQNLEYVVQNFESYNKNALQRYKKKEKGNHVPLYFLELINGVFSYYRN